MTICAGCGNEVGNLYCGHCRSIIEKKHIIEKPEGLVPLLFYDTKEKCYRFGCQCFLCPCNANGICGVKNLEKLELLMQRMHEFDGDNIIRQVCG